MTPERELRETLEFAKGRILALAKVAEQQNANSISWASVYEWVARVDKALAAAPAPTPQFTITDLCRIEVDSSIPQDEIHFRDSAGNLYKFTNIKVPAPTPAPLAPLCNAPNRDGSYRCNKEPGHSGDHVYSFVRDGERDFFFWPAEPVVPPESRDIGPWAKQGLPKGHPAK